MLLYLCAFPVLIIAISFIQGINALIQKQFLSSSTFHQILAAIVILFYLIHPIITIGAFQSLSCQDVSGEQRLRANARILCFEGDHMKYTMNYTLPTVIFWVISTPLLLMWVNLRQNKLLQFVESQELEEEVMKNMVKHKNQFGFIIAGFQQKYLYWDFLIILRKAIMITISIFTANFSGEFQSVFLLVTLFLFLLIHQRFQPYHEPYLNSLESSSLFIQLVFVFTGLFFQQSSHYTFLDDSNFGQVSDFFFVLLLFSNCHFFILWLYHFRRELLRSLIIPFTHTQQQPNLVKRIIFTVFACRTPKSYLAHHLDFTPDSLYYKCAPQVSVLAFDQTSVSMHKNGSNSLQQLQQDAVAVDDVMIEGEYKKNTFQSARARKHEQHKMIKAKMKNVEQLQQNRKVNQQQHELIEESQSPISDQRLNEEDKVEEGQSDTSALYSMINPSLTVYKNRIQDYEESPESFDRLTTTGTKRNSQISTQQMLPQKTQKAQKQPSQVQRGVAQTDQRGYNTSEFTRIQGMGPNDDNEQINNLTKKKRKKRRDYLSQIEDGQDIIQDHNQKPNL